MKIGFIGLGTMGRGIAANILKAEHGLAVYDINKAAADELLEAGASWADSPKSLAEGVEIVFSSLPRPSDVIDVYEGGNGLSAGLAAGKIWFDLSTNSVETVRKLHAELSTRGVRFLDAPVSGGPAGAASGQLAVWVGGDRAAFDRARPVLDTFSDHARYVGEIGAGSIAKLVHNLTATVMMQAIAEGMTIGVKAGLEPLQLYEALRAGATGRARSFDSIHRRWLPENLDPASFQLSLLHKDVKLAVEMARQVGVPSRLSQLALEDMTEALNRGWGARDAQSVLLLQQERAGLGSFGLTQKAIDDVMKE
ncbi:NAD(P)-dependent oxidoreductase [Paracoccus sp. SCSIO 75233]|uniref:NAD(P)-dependent oxidoreductase n=1 Tax=Paracoccus sp. SCSIO 75233 TaxID=3017782 RepID=UPI0022F0D56E|nr:NAD(P)-dependent oxidoreductase [Paracoccus sp. SCSIO 75233]WBU52051.1 NAD(P)-dependent oxidoreductase [Paracoccus sp. SCSIO 75233]